MALNMKIGVDMGEFRTGINDAKAHLKTLNAEMKLAESTFKATGNAEQAFATKTTTLTNKLNTQKQMVAQYEKALKSLKDANAENTKEYRNLETEMLNAKAAMMDTEAELNNLDNATQRASGGANQLVNSVNSIGKKMSLDQVITGINSITSGLETAASKAIQLGETIFSAVMDRARWADDTATMALMYGIDLDKFQRMQKLVTNGLDTSVDAILTAQTKLNKGIGNGTTATMDALRELGLLIGDGKYGTEHLVTEDSVELFWEAGRALMAMESSFDKEATAQALFGRSWKELVPLFKEYKSFEDYEKALEGVQVNSEEDVNALAELNDKVGELKGNLETLSTDILAKLAPALTEGANALNGMITSLLEYLKTDEGQAMLQRMGDAVSGLFESLGKIDPEKVIEGFAGVFTQIVGGLEWLTNNSGTVISALEAIVIGWGALKLTGGALEIIKLLDGLNTLRDKGMPQLPGTEQAWTGTGAGTETGAGVVPGGGSTWFNTFLNNAVNGMGVKAMYDLNNYVANLFRSTMEGKTTEEKQEYALMHDFGITQEELFSGPGVSHGRKFNIEMDLPEETKRLFEQTIDLTKNQPAAYNPMDEIKGMTLEEKQAYALMHDFGIKPIEDNDHFVVEDVDIEAILNAKEGKEQIEEQVGIVDIPVRLTFGGGGGGGGTPMYVFDHWNGMMNRLGTRGFANGLWSVPYDGFLARLHKNERIVPAREVWSSRNFSSNLYVESMYMNNGTDAAGLASAMAAAQRRTMNGFGS